MREAPSNLTRVGPAFGWGLSARKGAAEAAEAALGQAMEDLAARSGAGGGAGVGAPSATLAVVFASGAHGGKPADLASTVRRAVGDAAIVGCTASGVVAGPYEVDEGAAVAVLLAALPGVRVTPFDGSALADIHNESPELDTALLERLGMHATDAGQHRATIVLGDPFSVPITRALARVDTARRRRVESAGLGPIVGGMASAGKSAGGNALFLDDGVRRDGVVGVSLSGPLRVDTVVSQGCRPVGPTFVVTRSKGNLILELGGRPAVERAREVAEDLTDEERRLLGGGLLIGRAVNEYRDRFGRGDFLIRAVVGGDPDHGYLAVSDLVPPGRTVQFHLRDKVTAEEDLAMLLDGQQVHDRPAGALMFTCNGRGRQLFETIGHDSQAFQRAFGGVTPGADMAKGGIGVGGSEEEIAPVPMAGFFAAGEIGPVDGRSFLHGHTASIALFRPVDPPDQVK